MAEIAHKNSSSTQAAGMTEIGLDLGNIVLPKQREASKDASALKLSAGVNGTFSRTAQSLRDQAGITIASSLDKSVCFFHDKVKNGPIAVVPASCAESLAAVLSKLHGLS